MFVVVLGVRNVIEMNYNVEEELDRSVLAVHIDGELDFIKEKL